MVSTCPSSPDAPPQAMSDAARALASDPVHVAFALRTAAAMAAPPSTAPTCTASAARRRLGWTAGGRTTSASVQEQGDAPPRASSKQRRCQLRRCSPSIPTPQSCGSSGRVARPAARPSPPDCPGSCLSRLHCLSQRGGDCYCHGCYRPAQLPPRQDLPPAAAHRAVAGAAAVAPRRMPALPPALRPQMAWAAARAAAASGA